MKTYNCILIDPPWKYGSWGSAPKNHRPNDKARPLPYNFMEVEEISALPIPKLMAENCEFFMWTTQKYLPVSFELLKGWKLEYKTTITWIKKPMGKGQGGLFCPTTEFLVHGRKGKTQKQVRIDSTWFFTKREPIHSRKPDLFMSLIERVSVGSRLEMFARERRRNWDVFGDQVKGSINLAEYET